MLRIKRLLSTFDIEAEDDAMLAASLLVLSCTDCHICPHCNRSLSLKRYTLHKRFCFDSVKCIEYFLVCFSLFFIKVL